MRSVCLGIVALLALAADAQAAKLSSGSIMGRWCGADVTYSIGPGSLTVMRKGAKSSTMKITRIQALDNEVQVFFAAPYGGGSRFSEFGADGRSMVQQGSTFGTMPRRAFKRC